MGAKEDLSLLQYLSALIIAELPQEDLGDGLVQGIILMYNIFSAPRPSGKGETRLSFQSIFTQLPSLSNFMDTL